MSAPKLLIPNLDPILKANPKLGEALNKVQQYINANTVAAAGNKTPAPSFVTTTRPPG